LPSWIPVVVSLSLPILFSTNGLFTKHLCGERVKFDASTLTFSSTLLACLVNLLVAVCYYWIKVEQFDFNLLWFGFIGSLLDTIGVTSFQVAIANGPAGPVCALASLNTILLTIIQAIISKKVPAWLEIVGFVIGFFGATILVLPDQFEKILRVFKSSSQ